MIIPSWWGERCGGGRAFFSSSTFFTEGLTDHPHVTLGIKLLLVCVCVGGGGGGVHRIHLSKHVIRLFYMYWHSAPWFLLHNNKEK